MGGGGGGQASHIVSDNTCSSNHRQQQTTTITTTPKAPPPTPPPKKNPKKTTTKTQQQRNKPTKRMFVCWLLNVPATCECISGTANQTKTQTTTATTTTTTTAPKQINKQTNRQTNMSLYCFSLGKGGGGGEVWYTRPTKGLLCLKGDIYWCCPFDARNWSLVEITATSHTCSTLLVLKRFSEPQLTDFKLACIPRLEHKPS